MIGKQIAQYRIKSELGGGGMGVVYRAEDTTLGREVALKLIAPEKRFSAADNEVLLHEARSTAALNHPNICTVYEIGEQDGFAFISMEYVSGKRLDQLIAGEPLEVQRALDIAGQIALGLETAHANAIVHRDIKCGNVIVDDNGRATILDFGIAELSGQEHLGKRVKAGTLPYMSPEQAGRKPVDHRTDIWSLGVCLYRMLTGRLPFEGAYESALTYQIVNQDPPPLADLAPGLPDLVVDIVDRALKKSPDDRYQNAKQILADLTLASKALQGETTVDRGNEPSVAVLPFTNMSSDQEQDYFCDGIAEDIITSLSHIDGLQVASRTSSFALRDSALDIREIGGKLGVDTIVEGSVRKSGDRLRITAQLVKTSDGYHLWSERYDRDQQDVFAIQDEIGRNIVDALKIELTDREKKALSKVYTNNLDAYEFYVRGRRYFHSLGKKGLEYARNMFTSAIIRDSNFALAYCGLADCYSMIQVYYDSDRTNVENALTASQKALELDSELAEAHASYGLAMSTDGRYKEAVKEFEKAIELSPRLFETYYFYARTCRSNGDLKQAAELFDKASAVRPEDYQAPILAADTYRGLDQPERMAKAFERGLSAAERHLEFHPDDARAWYLGAHAHNALGAKQEALHWNQRAMELSPDDPATLYNAACLFSIMGETDRCFECLELAIDNGFAHPQWLESDPDLESIRTDPRYGLLRDRLE